MQPPAPDAALHARDAEPTDLETDLELHVDRQAFLVARIRDLETRLARVEREAAAAVRRADGATASLARMRGRRLVRWAERLSRSWRRLRRPTSATGAPATTSPSDPAAAAAAPASIAVVDDPIHAPTDPTSWRRAMLARLGSTGGMRAQVIGPEAAALAAALDGLGWGTTVGGSVERTAADVLLVAEPAVDPHPAPESAVRVAWVRGALDAWLVTAAIDDYDLVLTEDAAAAARIRASTVHVPVVATTGSDLLATLCSWVEATHLDVTIGTPTPADGPRWGDYHFAWSFRRALQRRGLATRIRYRNAWDGPTARRADAVIHLFGLRDRPTSDHQLDVLWVISHPERVDDTVLANHDLVFVASDTFATHLRARSDRPIHVLPQATDPERFRPTPGGEPHDLLLVAGYRPDRPTIRELTPTHHDLAVIGHGWTPDVLDPRHLVAEHVPNDRLAALYSAAGIVLDDHWPEMVEWGFISNRAYDAAASGAFVLSDAVAGMDEAFDGGVATYASGRELRRLVGPYLADPERRRAMAARARAAVLARHTFDHRVTTMLEVIGPELARRGAGRGATTA